MTARVIISIKDVKTAKYCHQSCLMYTQINVYPNHFKMQVSVGDINALGKALIAENGYSLFKINNAA
jgi:hypothetical protein